MSRISRTGGSPATPQPEVRKVASKVTPIFSANVQPPAATHSHTAAIGKANPKITKLWKARKVA